MLETIRQFAEEQLVATGEAETPAPRTRDYFAGREADVLALWDSPRQREAYEWFDRRAGESARRVPVGGRPRRSRHRAAIAVYAAFLGFWVEQYEPHRMGRGTHRARAKAVDHRRLAQLYAMAAQCYVTGRIDDAFGYAEAAQLAIDSGRFDEVPFEFEASLGGAYCPARASPSAGSSCAATSSHEIRAHIPITPACLAIASHNVWRR